MKVEGTERFPHKWETVVPMKPCQDPGCNKIHGGHIAVGAEDGKLLLGLYSDLGSGALRLNNEETLSLMEDLSVAIGVMIGLATRDAIGLYTDLSEAVDKAFDTIEGEHGT